MAKQVKPKSKTPYLTIISSVDEKTYVNLLRYSVALGINISDVVSRYIQESFPIITDEQLQQISNLNNKEK